MTSNIPATRQQRRSILIVEDGDAIRASLRDWLGNAYPSDLFLEARSGEEAISISEARELDIVLMDVNLPDMNGIDTTRHIKRRVPRTQVVMLSAHEAPEYQRAAAGAGAIAYVPKRRLHDNLLPLLDSLLPAATSPGGTAHDEQRTMNSTMEGVQQENPAHLRHILEAINEGIWVCDTRGSTLFVNQKMAEMLGAAADDLIGTPLRAYHGEQQHSQNSPCDFSTAEPGAAQRDVLLRRRDGSTFWALMSSRPLLDEEAQLAGTVATFTDISDRKAAEQTEHAARAYADAIIETMREPLLVLDAGFRVRRANRAFYETFEVSPGETEGISLFHLGEGQWNIPALRELLEDILPGNTQIHDFEVSHYFPRIGHRTVLLNARHIHQDGAGTATILLAMEDITERRLAEDRLAQQAQELAHYNAELQQFAYVASHDLQEPLRMVASYVQLLARRYRGKLDSDADEFIGYAVDGASRMQQLINDLLKYSRVGTRSGSSVPVDCNDLLAGVLDNLQVAIEESGAVITAGPLPTVAADPVQLAQVFQNLIGNAIKFHGDQPPRAHVSATEQASEWLFSVRDNGIGIDPEYFNRVFVIFQRLHGRSDYPGTGIGLAIAKKIVERHGGQIWIESVPGAGSTFHFTLPTARDAEAKEEELA
jgi:PAS domain S-box-containing protein